MAARPLVYYTVFGGDVFYDNLRLSVESLREFGAYTGDILVFSDKPVAFGGAENIVLPLPDTNESVAIRITCYKHFDFAPYDRLLFLDADILACRDVSALFAFPETLTYFAQNDRYYTTGAIDALYFDRETWRKNWWRHPINAGQFVLAGSRFEGVMRQWEAVCERFAHRRVFTMNESYKKIWRDQVAWNYLLRTGQLVGTERPGIVHYPPHFLALRWLPLTRYALLPDRHLLWHFSGFPAPLANRALRQRLAQLRNRR